jgi:serine/threonine protein kinase/tetratricopeptide (TPR) repeat protein
MPETSDTLRPGERVGNYQILAMAGAGGMGVVYKALDLKLERTVALKFLPAEVYASEKDRERFLKEARTASSLDHTNIGVIHGVEETGDGRAFIVMAFYEGESLAQKIRRGPLKLREAGDIAMQVAKGLEAAHARNIVHRDVKPSNILITPQGVVKIVDFGLARVVTSASMTQTGGTSGTVGYMSPEQSLGKPIDVRTDVWALGVVLDEMLTGQNPFWRDNVPSTVVAILNEPPRPMEGVPPELQQIVYRALSKEPSYRYQNCTEMRGDLENVRGILTPSSAIDLAAPTVSIKSGQFQKYLSHASQSAWMPASQRKNRAWIWWLCGGVAFAVALVVVGWLLLPLLRRGVNPGFSAPDQEHIAVLPFDNIGNDPANVPLAEGLMDSLTGRLSDLDVGGKSLWVVPSSEVRRSKIADPTAALREWGATVVVKGSIARDGQTVQLTVNLIDAKNLRQIGSGSFEDRAGDLASLQDEAVAKLAKLMHINVTPEMLRATGGSANPVAYESYLKAVGYVSRYDTPGNLDLAITALKDTVKADPQFALGFAELGEAYRLKYSLDQNPKWLEEASANCSHALQLDDRLPSAFVTLGSVHADSDKFDLALQEYQHALQLEPHNADALMGTANTYEKMGRVADAEDTYKKGVALRPDDWDGYNTLGIFYSRQSRYADAIAQLQHAAQLTPDNALVYLNLAAAYLNRGDPKDFPLAESALKKSIELGPTYPAYANLAFLYMDEKRYAESVAMSQKALQLNDKNYLVWANLMSAYQALDQKDNLAAARDHAIRLLEEKVKLAPQDALSQVSLAALYAQKGAREKALIRVQAALARAPEDSKVLELAGETYENLGDRPRALEYIEKALQKGYSLDDLKSSPDLQDLLFDPKFRPNTKKSNP